jgi:hypothetical protein
MARTKKYRTDCVLWSVFALGLFIALGFVNLIPGGKDDCRWWSYVKAVCEGRRNGSTMVGIIVGQGLLLAVPAVVLGWLGQAIAVVGGLRVTRPIDPAQLADYGDGPAPRVQ